MSNTGFQGVDVRQTANELVFRFFFQTSAGAKETAGPVNLSLYELQSDGTLKSYDFSTNTFVTTALTTATASMTHQKGNNGTVNTGVWTYALSTLTGFTKGGVYLAQANDASASPTDQTREFQFGSAQGDLTVDSHNNLNTNMHDAGGNAIIAGAIPAAAAGAANGLPTIGTGAGQIHVDGAGNVYAVDSLGNQLASFAEVANIAVTSAALNATASSETLTTGTGTGGVSNTVALDGVYDTWTASAGAILGYYQFNLSGTTGAVGTSVQWDGYYSGTGSIAVTAFNWSNSTWEQIGKVSASTGTPETGQSFELTNSHTGTGANAGLVRIRFDAGSGAQSLNTDRILLGYAVVLTPPANWSALGIGVTGHMLNVDTVTNSVVVGTNNDKTGYRLAVEIRNGTAQAGAAGSITLDSGASATDNLYKGCWIVLTTGTGAGQARLCTAYVGSTKVATVLPAWTTAPDVTSVFTILPAGDVLNVEGNVTGSVATVTNAVTLPTIPTNWITATGIAASALNGKGDWLLASSAPTNFSSLGIGATGHVLNVDTLTTYTGNTPQTGDSFARLGAPAGASIAADIAAVKTDTGNLVTRISSTLFSGITSLAQWLGLMAGNQTGNSTARTELRATGAGGGTYDETADSLEAIRARGDVAWGTSGNVTVGGYAAGQDPATLVLDVAAASHNTAGTIGAKINSAASAGDPWSTSEPGSYVSGTFGYLVAHSLPLLDVAVSSRLAASSYQASPVSSSFVNSSLPGNTPYTKTFTQGDLRTNIADVLVDATGTPINLTGSTVAFRMISQSDKSVKVNNAAANLDDAPNGKVSYTWQATDLNTPGLYFGWWIVTTGGKTEHFPGDGEKMTVKVVVSE